MSHIMSHVTWELHGFVTHTTITTTTTTTTINSTNATTTHTPTSTFTCTNTSTTTTTIQADRSTGDHKRACEELDTSNSQVSHDTYE